MELKSTINIILKDLEDARDLIDDLRNYPGVPLIQIELARAKCRSAEDVIRLLSSLLEEKMAATTENREASRSVIVTEPREAHQTEASGEESYVSNNRDGVKESDPVNMGETEENSFAKSSETENHHSVITTEAPEGRDNRSTEALKTADHPETEAPEGKDNRSTEALKTSDHPETEAPEEKDNRSTEALKTSDHVANEAPEAEDHHLTEADEQEIPHSDNRSPRIVADRFSHLSERINEQIGDSKNGSHDSTRVKKNITDITKEIGINDRFFLIREMFGGNQEQYTSALNELNRVTSNEEARQVIEKYSSSSGDKEAGKMLSELVKRKLSSTHG
jgi:hypothetical protein